MLLRKSVLKALPYLVIAAVAGAAPALGATTSKSLDAVGPIEALDCNSRTIRVLGVAFRAVNSSVLAAVCVANGSETFRYVAIAGILDTQGSLFASRVSLVADSNYVPGSTATYLRGPVTNRKSRVGEFGIAGSRIVGLPTQTFALGEIVEVVGTQPVLGGPVVASQLQRQHSSTGTVGSDNLILDGIVGSGISASGIVGSGVVQNGIVGSGVSANGIVGSGVTTSGIVGSGVAANGTVGSGVSTSGIVGSGISTKGIVGSGVAINGIVGSGITTNGIVGSGISTNGIVGSGVATKGIVGSGVSTNGIVGSG